MPKSIEEILSDVQSAIKLHESQLGTLVDDAEKSLLDITLETERRIAVRLRQLLPEFEQAKIGGDKTFRIQNTSGNIDITARIYSIIQNELQPFSDEATQWAIENLSDAFDQGVRSVIDTYNAGAREALSYTFTEQDAMVMEIALTKGYGKEQRGIGMIKGISQETSDSIRDIMLRGIAERKTTTQLMAELWNPEVGLTSLEIFDSLGRRRTLSLRGRAKVIARNEIGQIYQVAATEKARDVFGEDPYWYYGSVYEPETMTVWCKKRFGRIAKVSQWNDTNWLRSQFGDSRTGTGHIHVNCRQSGHAVSEDWFTKSDWNKAIGNGKPAQHILLGEDLRNFKEDAESQIPVSQILGE